MSDNAFWLSIKDSPPPHRRIVLLGWARWYDKEWTMEVGPASFGPDDSKSFHGSATHWKPLDAEYREGLAIAAKEAGE